MDKASILRRTAAIGAALLATASVVPGAAQQGEDADDADAQRSGPKACINRSDIRRTKILSDRNIVFVTRQNEIFSNQLAKQCPNLTRNSVVNYPISGGRMCEGDRFQVLWEQRPGSYLPTSLCPLGVFVPITESELEDLTAMTEENRAKAKRGRSTREAATSEQIELPAAETPANSVEPAPAEQRE
jgi:hypothetical protein